MTSATDFIHIKTFLMLMDNPFILFGAWIISIVIAAFIFKSFFNVSTHNWYQARQLDILQKIAEKQGVSQEEINQIMSRR